MTVSACVAGLYAPQGDQRRVGTLYCQGEPSKTVILDYIKLSLIIYLYLIIRRHLLSPKKHTYARSRIYKY